MRTDKQVYEILEAYPQWLFELTGLPSPGPCRFQSVTLKAIERRTDGVLVPDAEHEPLSGRRIADAIRSEDLQSDRDRDRSGFLFGGYARSVVGSNA